MEMKLLMGIKEEAIRKFFNGGGRIVTAKQLEKCQLLIIAVSRDGSLLRAVVDQKSRLHRELLHREKYETPYIVELPGEHHPEDDAHLGYSVSLPRTKRVIALRYEEQTPSTSSSSSSEPKTKRIRTAAQWLGEKDEFCCRTCFKRFSRKFNLQRHEESCLPKPILYQCPVCRRKFQKAPYFAAHIRMHESEEESQNQKKKKLAIEAKNDEEQRKRADASVQRLAIPYEFGAFL